MNKKKEEKTDWKHNQEINQLIARREKEAVYGFYENEFPTFAQGPPTCELQCLVTAEQVTKMSERIRELEQGIRNTLIGIAKGEGEKGASQLLHSLLPEPFDPYDALKEEE